MATGYEPLNVPKLLAEDIWLVDGPHIGFYGLPFSTRATIVRLENGDLWVHSPIRLTAGLVDEVRRLGQVRYLVAPNWIHYAYLSEWQAEFEGTMTWAAPGVVKRAADRGMELHVDHELLTPRRHNGREKSTRWLYPAAMCIAKRYSFTVCPVH